MIEINPQEKVKIWVEQYSDGLYKWAYHKTSDYETARDLVQDTFLAAVKGIANFEGKSNAKTWLFSILNNKIADHYRKQYKQVIISEASLNNTHSKNSFFDQKGNWEKTQTPEYWQIEEGNLLDDENFKIQLKGCLDELPPAWNKIIKLKFIADIDGKQICQEFGISQTNYWQILHRAKLQLRKCLEIHWFK